LGELKVPGQPIGAFWMFPHEDTGASQAELNSVPLKVVRTNLFGTDAQDLNFPLAATPNAVGRSYTSGAIWQQGILFTNGPKISFYTGGYHILNWPGERTGVGASGQLLCRGFWVKDHQLRILVERVALFGGSGNSLWWVEEYDERTDTFHQVSRVVDTGGLGDVFGATAVGSYPVSTLSDIMYWHDDTRWSAQLFTDITRNPAYDLSGITSAGLHYGFEEEAVWTSPEFLLPGLGKVPSVISEIQFIGEPDRGGDDGSVTVEVANQDRTGMSFTHSVGATFKGTDRWASHHRHFRDNKSAFDRLQIKITGRRGSEANVTPLGLPVVLRGLAFLDGKIRAPIEVLGATWDQRFQ
jgi:hypothetical protein